MRRILGALAVIALTVGVGTAYAVPIGTISGCTDCDGLVFTLDRSAGSLDLDGDGAGDDWLYTLTLNTAGYTGGPAATDYIAWVGPNLAFHDGAAQTAQPSADWVFHDGGTNNGSGCTDVLAAGKVCSETSLTTTTLNNNYMWAWELDLDGGEIVPPHLQAAWFHADGKKAGAISINFTTPDTGGTDTGASEGGDTGATETGSEVPEPASMLLLGSGLAAAAVRMRRNRK